MKHPRKTFRPRQEGDAKTGVRPRLLPLLAGIVFVTVSFCFVGSPVRDLSRHISAGSWKEVPCTILRAELGENKRRDAFCVEITYQYVVDGKRHTGKRVRFSGNLSAVSFAEARAFIGRYPGKSPQTCLVNPENPENAVLELAPVLEHVLPVLFLFLCGVFGVASILVSAWPFLRRKNKMAQTSDATGALLAVCGNSPVQAALESLRNFPSKKQLHPLFITLFGLPFFAVGIYFGSSLF
ncbi:MAG: DUF3592 domain-containing protein [Puniceicoccales bacterium]|nr:DUF3592 domain-containing protein [Puniceicoccales bacterium]